MKCNLIVDKSDAICRGFMRTIVTIMVLLLTGFYLPAMAQSVEKADTSQQAKEQVDELQLAREAVAKRDSGEKPESNGVGRITGNYSMMSTIEVGYRFTDTNGSRATYLSDVNVRDGWRLFDYSMDLRSIDGNGPFFDFLRTDITNAGGDAGQYFSLRVEKTRAYKFDATVRRFNYFRSLATFALNEHNLDLRQQISDYNLKLFPQRRVRVNISYGRELARGPFTSTYDFERDEFPIIGRSRWAANDYRIGIDTSINHWDIFIEQMFRNFRDDSEEFTSTFQAGNQTTGPSVLTSFLRLEPARSRARVTRASISGDITERGHLVLRGLYGSENLDVNEFEQTSGADYNGNKIISRRIIDSARVHRPSTTADAVFTYDIGRGFAISDSFRFLSYRIAGNVDSLTVSSLQPPQGNGVINNLPSFANEFTGVASYWNTVQLNYSAGLKFSVNGGVRSTYRDITLRHFNKPDELETQATNTFIAGARYRPIKRVNLFLNYENGRSDNAFVNINPLEYRQLRVRTNIQATDKLAFNASFSATDRTNPTRFVRNDGNARSVTVAVFFQPNARLLLNGGYDYNYFHNEAEIAYFSNFALKRGFTRYYARQNFIFLDGRLALTRRLDLLFAYRFTGDLGAPKLRPGVTVGPNDFTSALPLTRHNPEVRLAYRFSDHITGNCSYRYYSYDERDRFVQDYRANIFTTSLRYTF